VLPESPRGFPLVPRYELRGLRRMVHGGYLIFYRVSTERVEVVHVLNGASDHEPVLFPEG
jgi:toxin ParE1/3/4